MPSERAALAQSNTHPLRCELDDRRRAHPDPRPVVAFSWRRRDPHLQRSTIRPRPLTRPVDDHRMIVGDRARAPIRDVHQRGESRPAETAFPSTFLMFAPSLSW